MDIEITERREKSLMGQEIIELAINHTGEATPSKNAVRKQVAAELDLDPLTLSVDSIYSSSGSGRATGRITVHPEQVIDELPEKPDGGDDEEEDVSEEPESDDEDAADTDAADEDTDDDEDAADQDTDGEEKEEEEN